MAVSDSTITSGSLSHIRCLTFDCYGTLVDWESGIYDALQPILKQVPASQSHQAQRSPALKAFVRHEHLVQIADPTKLYRDVLAQAFGNFATELGISVTEEQRDHFGASVKDWPVFPDTLEALKRLKRHFKLVILSNVDLDSFAGSVDRAFRGLKFDAIYTAEVIGSYKPDLANFEYLIDHCGSDLGVRKQEILHVANSLFHDVQPASRVGLPCVWIERGEEHHSVMGGDIKDFGDLHNLMWSFKNMGHFAQAVDTAAG